MGVCVRFERIEAGGKAPQFCRAPEPPPPHAVPHSSDLESPHSRHSPCDTCRPQPGQPAAGQRTHASHPIVPPSREYPPRRHRRQPPDTCRCQEKPWSCCSARARNKSRSPGQEISCGGLHFLLAVSPAFHSRRQCATHVLVASRKSLRSPACVNLPISHDHHGNYNPHWRPKRYVAYIPDTSSPISEDIIVNHPPFPMVVGRAGVNQHHSRITREGWVLSKTDHRRIGKETLC